MNIVEPRSVKTKLRGHKLKSDANWRGELKENKGAERNGCKSRPWVLRTQFSIFFFTSNVNVLHFLTIHFRFIFPRTRTSPSRLLPPLYLTVRIPC